jgi:ABC-type transport system involved in cytochrome c biogenesis permease subunit
VLVSMIAERFYRNGIAIVVGSVTGFCTLIIAHMLSLDGDTMVMLQAVLDTDFWLATHVTSVTLGYTMAFVAGFMGIAYILLGMFTDRLRKEGAHDLSRATYGVLCAGMFLSFVGTVLGGLWADYSWGRFWGWDPKENGALLIVLWIALILHARWGGMVKQRGMAVLCVLGNIITAWSWFGTNFLGVGLHAYGGSKGAQMLAMVLIDFGFLGIACLGMLPLTMWQSFRPLSSMTPPTGSPSPPSPSRAKPKLA